MAKRMIEGIEIETGSGNVFADLDLPDAEKLKIKSGLVAAILKVLPGLVQRKVLKPQLGNRIVIAVR